MTYTDPRQRDLRGRLDAILSQAGFLDYHERALQMLRALIEGVDPRAVVLPPLAPSRSATTLVTSDDRVKLGYAVDRVWQIAQDEQHHPRIMAGLMRLAQP